MKTNPSAIARNVKQIYFDTDVRMKSIPKICEEGCSFCCHQNVLIHGSEGPAIEKFIQEEMPSETKTIVRQNLISWFNYFDKNTPNGVILTMENIVQFEKQIAIDRIPCAFLINDRCSIYKARPLVCRTHSVSDSSQLCNQDPHRNGDSAGLEIQKKKFGEITKASGMLSIRLLAYAVQETLGLNRDCKAVSILVSLTHQS
jgi:Fe-S-cluster containining protein